MNVWIYRLADGVFLRGGPYEPDYDLTTEGRVVLPDEQMPDIARERYDGTRRSKRRLATDQELADAQSRRIDAQLEGALVTGDVIIRAAFAHLAEVVTAIHDGTFDLAAQDQAVAAVKATAKVLLLQARGGV